jgi:chorismate synthase
MLRYFTAGESHGPCLTMIIDGVPAGFPVDPGKINHDLWRCTSQWQGQNERAKQSD